MNVDNTLLGTILMLFMGHFTGDFVLQNDRIAVEKCPGSDVTLPWFWWMIAHSACHGLITATITGYVADNMYLCYQSSASEVSSAITCAAAVLRCS